MKYKLYIRQYDITTNDYKVREEIVETNDIYHEIGKIYSTAFTEIKRIDYEKIDETKELRKEIERLNNKVEELMTLYTTEREVKEDYKSIIKEVREYIEENTQWYDKELGLVEMEGHNSNRIPVVYLYGLLEILDKVEGK